MKKQKAKKTGAKTEEAPATASKDVVSETHPPNEDVADTEEQSAAPIANDAPTATKEPNAETTTQETSRSHQRKPSLSVQSKMRSSSFRQSSITSPSSTPVGLRSPTFDPEEGTAPEIFRKQASKIEELERENKRLAKEASEGEKRWRKAEEELEDLREAELDQSKPKTAARSSGGAADELEKLVRERNIVWNLANNYTRKQSLALFNDKIHNSKPKPPKLVDMVHRLLYHFLLLPATNSQLF